MKNKDPPEGLDSVLRSSSRVSTLTERSFVSMENKKRVVRFLRAAKVVLGPLAVVLGTLARIVKALYDLYQIIAHH